uniref:Pyridoxamine 5-phosphate oxidase n=3 Tax=Tetraselmis sp. GSL018 TaxID=582737 RepID=A0A061QXV9_9CHLO|mmetsp:Transcript_42405/g.100646  ORF Transcript_42405/g.100646 Transcript_42405/m.100646 type:complete len:209 (+) Transcript_42405:194-820(+)
MSTSSVPAAVSEVPWQQLVNSSLKANKRLPYAKYVQLATVREDGRPANRTVVFRGFLWNTEKLTFVTDRRSSKINDISSNRWCEIAWYFPDSREQYRIQGTMALVHADEEDEKLARARAAAWRNLSGAGRAQFSWPHPGLPRPEPEDKSPYDVPCPSTDDPASSNFSLAVLDPSQVDYLHLKKNVRKLFRLSVDGAGARSWAEEELNP